MGVFKRACQKCGQKVSGDESFFGSTVSCPICSADIYFPYPEGWQGARSSAPPPADPTAGSPPPQAPAPHPSQQAPTPAPEPPPAAPQGPPPGGSMDDTQSYQPQHSQPSGYTPEGQGLPGHSHTAALDPSNPAGGSAYGSPEPPPGTSPQPVPHPAPGQPPAEGAPPAAPDPAPGPTPGDHHDESLDVDRSDSGAPSQSSPPPEPAPGPPPSEPTDTAGDAAAHTSIPVDRGSSSKPGPPVLPLVSLITGILGLVTCVGFILLSPAAIITGHMALSKGGRAAKQPFPGKKLALVGLILGYIGLVGGLIGLALMATGVVGGTGSVTPIDDGNTEEAVIEFEDPNDPSLE